MNIVILAAGLGKRMFSHLPKVLQPVGGKPMLEHVVEAARKLPDAGKIIVVVGHGSEEVKAAMAGQPVSFVLQKEQKGTGHAVQQALEAINPEEPTLILTEMSRLSLPKLFRRLRKRPETVFLC